MQDLTVSANELREASERLDRAVASGRLRSPIAMHAAELAWDILIVAPLLDEERASNVSALRAEDAETRTALILRITGRREDNADARRLFALTKAFYFFVRAYHDSLYGVLFELVTGTPTRNRRMQEAAKRPENPVGKLIRTQTPEYLDWFARYRNQRNAIKDGTGFSIVGPTDDLGIAFSQFTAPGGVHVSLHDENIVRVSDLIAALEASVSLTDLATAQV